MSVMVNWEKRRRMLDGFHGVNPYRSRKYNPPTKDQIIYINDLVKTLESNGVEVKWLLEDGHYARHKLDAVCLIKNLKSLMADSGLYRASKTEYINLCRHKETGKKIKYRTSKFGSAPKGYEFLGQLSKETIYYDVEPD